MGKGKLSGSARKEINQRRVADVVKGKTDGVAFGRVTKLLGFNHIMIAIQTKSGSKEIRVRIPKLFSKKGATPITTRDVVTIYVGPEFDPDAVKPTDQFDITAILTVKQANDLVLTGEIPRWMVHEEIAAGNAHTSENNGMGWEFGYSDKKDDGEDETDSNEGEKNDDDIVKEKTKGSKNVLSFAKSVTAKSKGGAGDDDDDGSDSSDFDVDAI
jgi:hypothetical protein